jgi:predicted amidohydrolase YtcJ
VLIAVGTNEEIAKFIGPLTKTLELQGAMVLPGLIDSHAHLHSLGENLATLNISDVKSFNEVVAVVAARAKTSKPGDWIIGGRWDNTRWADNSFPVHDILSKVSPNNPVYLTRIDGNSALVNAKALELAGINKDRPNPQGGVIVRDDEGFPTGLLINSAMNLVKELFPQEPLDKRIEKFRQAVTYCNQNGLTGIQEAGVGPQEIELYKNLIDSRDLNIRLYAMLGEQEVPVLDVDLESYFKKNRIDNYGNHMLKVRSVKLFFDGALGSRGAAFFEPYADDPDNYGLLRVTPEYITKVSKAALAAGMGVNTHCIGIKGNRLCLDAYELALNDFPNTDHRFRIVHAQVVRQEEIDLFTKLEVIPAMMPTHCTSDMRFVEDRIGEERTKFAYAWRSFIDAGHPIPCGSDFPVESVNPLYGIYSAVTRQDHNGLPENGWHPEQRMTIQEAIKGFTIWPAYSAWQEDLLGSIEVGKLADITILDKDLLTIEPKEILKTKVLATIVGGQIKYLSTK